MYIYIYMYIRIYIYIHICEYIYIFCSHICKHAIISTYSYTHKYIFI